MLNRTTYVARPFRALCIPLLLCSIAVGQETTCNADAAENCASGRALALEWYIDLPSTERDAAPDDISCAAPHGAVDCERIDYDVEVELPAELSAISLDGCGLGTLPEFEIPAQRIAALSSGTHSISIRVETRADGEAESRWSPFMTEIFQIDRPGLSVTSATQYTITNDRPAPGDWIDIPATSAHPNPVEWTHHGEQGDGFSEGDFELPPEALVGLAPGRHTLWVRVRDSEGFWLAPLQSRFEIAPSAPTTPYVQVDRIIGEICGNGLDDDFDGLIDDDDRECVSGSHVSTVKNFESVAGADDDELVYEATIPINSFQAMRGWFVFPTTYAAILEQYWLNFGTLSTPRSPIALEDRVSQSVDFEPRATDQLYTIEVPPGATIMITLRANPDEDRFSTQQFIRARWGERPTNFDFEFEALDGGRWSTHLAIRSNSSETQTLYILASTLLGAGSPGHSATIQASILFTSLQLSSMTPEFGSNGGRVALTVDGVGFDRRVRFSLEKATKIIFPARTVVLLPTRAALLFDLDGQPVGSYTLVARRGETEIPGLSFEVRSTSTGPIFEIELEASGNYAARRIARLRIRYTNCGDTSMPAPLLEVSAHREAYLRVERDNICADIGRLPGDCCERSEPAWQRGRLLVLALHHGAYAGEIPPGGSGELTILYRTEMCDPPSPDVDGCYPLTRLCPGCTFSISVKRLDVDVDDLIDWSGLAPPPELAASWDDTWPALSAQLGGTWRELERELGVLATRLQRRGVQAHSAVNVFAHATRVALGLPASSIHGRVLLSGSGIPVTAARIFARDIASGELVSSDVIDSRGSFALASLQASSSYELLVSDHIVSVVSGADEDRDGDVVTLPLDTDVYGLELRVSPGGDPISSVCSISDVDPRIPLRPIMPPASRFDAELGRTRQQILQAWDPNSKDGPVDDPEAEDDVYGLRLAGEEIVYMIRVENLHTATAAAQRIVITDRIDPRLDISTLRLLDASFGSTGLQYTSFDSSRAREFGYESLSADAARQSFASRVPAQEVDSDVDVIINAHVDSFERLITWVFQAVDRNEASSSLSDPGFNLDNDFTTRGFLPPNVQDEKSLDYGRGGGFVSFSIRSLSREAQTAIGGAGPWLVENEATIAFDLNDAIRTNSFKIRILPVAPPAPPHDGAEDRVIAHSSAKLAVESLSWTPSRYAESYEITVWPGEDTDVEPIASFPALAHAQLQPQPELFTWGQTYTVRVTARNGGGERTFDDLVLTVAEPRPCPSSPVDLTVERLGAGALFTWSDSAAAEWYSLSIGEDAEHLRHVVRGLNTNAFWLPDDDRQGDFVWELVAHGEGCPDLESTARSLGPSFKLGETLFVRGEVNDDGNIDISDPVALLNYLFNGGMAPPCLRGADANGSGRLDLSDAVYALGFLFLGGPSPPAPFPACGSDGPDDLECEQFESCL